ncbi:hypothetical protein OS493_033051 [Desmophyllum pertusum]|uniref:Uncharacterized protein n=1 Tax=Desmophyllum pertusum TaxID=174260 RepID=A0A9W9ZK09_9CNID|nr:hypothetical protein OS493_033051 [Desmophyllum pertusum]
MNGVHLRTTSFMLAIKHTCRERKFKLRTCGHPCLKIDQKPENGGEYKRLRRRPHRSFNTDRRATKISYQKSMKSQTLLLQATLLLVLVACQVLAAKYYGIHKEVCEPASLPVTIKVLNCQAREVNLKQCAGTCLSVHSYNDKTCGCCKPIKKEPVEVEIICGGYRKNHKVYEHYIDHIPNMYVPTLHQPSTELVPTLYQPCTFYQPAPSLYQTCTNPKYSVPKLYHCTDPVPIRYQPCKNAVPTLYQPCTNPAPTLSNLYQPCTNAAPTLYQPCTNLTLPKCANPVL